MKAIAVWQPHASLIAWELKPYETRGWAPPRSLIGQRIAIHAAKKPLVPILQSMDDDVRLAIGHALHDAGAANRWTDLPLGAIVCTAVLSEVIRCDGRQIDFFGNYSAGRYAWKLEDVQRFEIPMPVRGAQGFFDVAIPAYWRAA